MLIINGFIIFYCEVLSNKIVKNRPFKSLWPTFLRSFFYGYSSVKLGVKLSHSAQAGQCQKKVLDLK
jgi:hypothetical protein